jgi:hypothetical protein
VYGDRVWDPTSQTESDDGADQIGKRGWIANRIMERGRQIFEMSAEQIQGDRFRAKKRAQSEQVICRGLCYGEPLPGNVPQRGDGGVTA